MSIKTNAEQIRDETVVGANTATRVGGNLVEIADELVAQDTEIALNTAKIGITATQANEITANTAKVSYTDGMQVASNTNDIADLVVITGDNVTAIALNTAKISFDSASSTKLGTIETSAEVNTINTTVTGEPTGSYLVLNVVSLTQAEYDAGTAVAGTFYAIVG